MQSSSQAADKAVEILLYPVCYARRQVLTLLAPFVTKVMVVPALEEAPVGPTEESSKESSGHQPGLPAVEALNRAPLNERKQEFSDAIRALKSWGEQMRVDAGLDIYYLAMKAGSTGSEEIESLVDLIKGDKDVDRIFAARVFLALSQEADMRRDEVDSELLKLHQESDRLKELVDGDSSIHSGPALPEVSLLHIEPLDRARERLREWARLAFTGPGEQADAWPLGESIAVKDLMDAAYESETGMSPVDLLEIPIPVSEGLVPSVPEGMVAGLSELLEDLKGRAIHDRAVAEEIEGSELVSILREEARQMAQGGRFGARLAVTLYPGMDWSSLILKAAKVDEGFRAQPPLKRELWGSLYLV